MRTTVTLELKQQSLEKAKKLIQEYKKEYKKGVDNSIKVATEAMYNKVLEYCYRKGIKDHTDAIHWEYDEKTNTGRVWTYDWVIIFNEMGTGVVGKDNPHPKLKSWKYDINEHGEKGWVYPKSDGTYGWTKGLPSRHMFYDAFKAIQYSLGEYVNVEMYKTVGKMYKRSD